MDFPEPPAFHPPPLPPSPRVTDTTSRDPTDAVWKPQPQRLPQVQELYLENVAEQLSWAIQACVLTRRLVSDCIAVCL